MLSRIERISLIVDRGLALSSEEEEDEESLDFRFDFLLEDFFLWDFLLDRSDLTDLWLLSLSSLLAELCLMAVRLLLSC